MVCKWQIEIDPYAQQVLAKHWPSVRRHDDVRTWPKPDTERVDVICGGSPCQDISLAGRGAGIEVGTRSGLWFEFARIIGDLRPRYVVVENVAAILGRGMGTVLGNLASLGYDAEWHCIQAKDVGAPHIRDRLFVVAYPKSIEARSKEPGVGSEKPRGKWAPSRASLGRFASSCRESHWGSEPGVCRVDDGVPGGVHRRAVLGNAVVPQIAQFIAERIIELDS